MSGQGDSDKQQTPRTEGSKISYLAQRERERGYVSTTPNEYRYPWVLNDFNMSNFKADEKIASV